MAEHAHREVIEDICTCRSKKYCLLKEIVMRTGLSDRQLEQVKCIEKFKWEKSASEGGDIGWERANELWVKEGYAKKFAEVYQDGLNNGELYNLTMGRT